jgi:rhamnogalacturonyl hydrolase YesR
MVKKIFLMFTLGCILIVGCKEKVDTEIIKPVGGDDTVVKINYYARSKTVLDLVNRFYYDSQSDLYMENYPAQTGDPKVSYLWPYVGVVSGINALRRLGYMKEDFDVYMNRFSKYYDNKRQPAAYSSYPPVYGNGDRFFDDNSIVGLEFVEAYETTKNPVYLQKAEEIMLFIYKGENVVRGGGEYWVEQAMNNLSDDNCTKAACSSTFATQLSLRLYKLTQKQEYLDFGLRVYTWMKKKLQDPADLLYWNDLRIRDGYINPTKWTYNSGSMIQNAVVLYQITKNTEYLDEAKNVAEASFNAFTHTANSKLFLPENDSWFNTCLFRGYLDLLQVDSTASSKKYVQTVIDDADYAWLHARNKYELFYEDWSGRSPRRDTWLLHQACMIEVYGRIGFLKGEAVKNK